MCARVLVFIPAEKMQNCLKSRPQSCSEALTVQIADWKQMLLLPYVFSEHWKPMRKLRVSQSLLVAGSGKRRKTVFSLLNLKKTWKVSHFWGAAAQHNAICCKQLNWLEKEGSCGCELGATPFGLELEAQLFSISQFSFSHFPYVASFLVPFSCLPAFLHAYFRKSTG